MDLLVFIPTYQRISGFLWYILPPAYSVSSNKQKMYAPSNPILPRLKDIKCLAPKVIFVVPALTYH